MLIEIFAIALAIVFALVYLARSEDGPDTVLLIGAALVLIVTGVFVGAEGIGVGDASEALVLSSTTEDSLVWNDSCYLDVTTFTTDTHFANSVVPYNYSSVAGALNDTYVEDGAYYSVEEGQQPTLEIYWNWTDICEPDYHTLYFNGHYDGNPAHYVMCEVYNYSSKAYQDCDADPTNDFPDAAADYDREWYFGSDDFYNGSNFAMRMQHTDNAAANHFMKTDLLYLTNNETGWFTLPAYTDCQRDSYNVTYTYENATTLVSTSERNDNMTVIISVVCLLVGIYLFLGGVSAYLDKNDKNTD